MRAGERMAQGKETEMVTPKKAGPNRQTKLSQPWLVSRVCTVEETACRDGEGFQW